MTYTVKREDEEIDEVLNECSEQIDSGGSKYPAMSYEQGVQAAILWLTGDSTDFNPNPMQD